MKALPLAKKQLAPLDCDNAWRGHVTFTLTSPNSKTARHRVFNVQRARNLDANCNGRAYFVCTPGNGQTKTAIEQVFSTFGCIGGPYNEGAFYRIIPFYDGDGVRRWTPAGHQLQLYFAHCWKAFACMWMLWRHEFSFPLPTFRQNTNR